mmetsp:Transcript_26278/g.49292  ORF Transcript_26278/g.49292 Transcript_26278/m.49292 type:complete len:273 (+) Transcript_26278:101-919(+)
MEINFASKKKSSKLKNPAKVIQTKILKKLPPDASSDSVQVMVTEVSCNEPDCVPLETLVICIGIQARWADKVLKPIADVTDSDLDELDMPCSWTEWIQSERERKGLKNDTSKGDSEELTRRTSATSTTTTTTQSQESTNSIMTSTSTVTAPPGSTMVTMRPRSDLVSSSSRPAVASTGIMPPPPPPPAVTTTSLSTTATTSTLSKPLSSATTTSIDSNSSKKNKPMSLKSRDESLPAARHSSKGVRQRGCPCCDPDNMDNILDKMLYFDAPP